jgi:hypothetical protein
LVFLKARERSEGGQRQTKQTTAAPFSKTSRVRKERDDIQLTVLEMDGRRVGGRD